MGKGTSSSGAARIRLIAWLGELGARWGLPPDACRLHGHLYLTAQAATAAELGGALGLSEAAVDEALAWLESQGLVQQLEPSRWLTGTDPWELVTTSLQHRRARELGPALGLLRASRREAAGDPLLERQVGRLLDLVEDIAAIDAQANRLSPATLRSLLGMSGRLARLFGGGRP
jgi:DNA-binding transcriptional regulator GbsR (MarR family)